MITRQSLKLAIESAIARAERIDEEWRREPDGAIRYAMQARGILETAEPTMAQIQAAAAWILTALSCCLHDFDSRNTAGWRPGGLSKQELFGLARVSNVERARICKERAKAFEQIPDDDALRPRERLHQALRPDAARSRRAEARA